jgi:signal transduction histidine kinase
MKKLALVLVLAVFAPSLMLAWLAMHSLRDQQFVMERQQSLLCQGVAEAVAQEVHNVLTAHRREFNQQVEALISQRSVERLATEFDEQLRNVWPLAEVGFVVSMSGQIKSPSLFDHPMARQFRLENDRFLCNIEPLEVHWKSPKGSISLLRADQGTARNDNLKSPGVGSATALGSIDVIEKSVYATKLGKVPGRPAASTNTISTANSAVPEEGEFRHLIGDGSEGTLARFLQSKLKLLFWYRRPSDPELVFGAQVNLPGLINDLVTAVRVEEPLRNQICVALLDDTGSPVAVSHPAFNANWKQAFIALELGEVLPHWEVAVHLLNPAKLGRSARAFEITLGLLIALLLLAIGVGSWLIVTDLKRQLTLARQKTDFVSNVSHELKTPLTSIRMFSELLAEGQVSAPEKQRRYLGIIAAETARLTRLINNVLDFARIERGEKEYEMREVELVALARDTIEAYRPQLEAAGFKLDCALPRSSVIIRGDRDALAQVFLNLISNAEKYSGENKELCLRLEVSRDSTVEVKVLDRGLGVPPGCEEKIFEQFYRAHDSLASGIQGSGLGLTLARQIARAHGGDVLYAAREGGGSCFTLRLPLMNVEGDR